MTNTGALPGERIESRSRRGAQEKGQPPGAGGERVTVNLSAKAAEALHEVATNNGDTKTDTINRALLIYAYLERVVRDGGKIYVREQGGDLEGIKFV